MKYTISDEKLREYGKLSVEQKLAWLEAARQFNETVFSEKDKQVRAIIKDGGNPRKA